MSTARLEAATSRSLLDAARRGREDAWERLVELYGPRVWGLCRRAGLSPDESADVFQEVFRAVAANVERFESSGRAGAFRAWLRAIASNKVRDHYRGRDRCPGGVGGTALQQRLADLPAPADALSTGSDDRADRWLLHGALERVRGHFEERTWRAFWATAVDGRPAADVAAELGMQAGAVRVAKSRVLARLRAEVGDLFP